MEVKEPTIKPVLRNYRFPSEHRSQAALDVRPFICTYDECDKSYSRLEHLRRHELSHEGNIECTEENCKQTFKNKYSLKRHVDIVHLKKTPKKYKCSECGEEFNKHNWLTSHQYKHSGIKPYVCSKEGCDKRFLTPSKLKRHMKVHEGYTCTKENCKVVSATWTLHRKHLALSHPKLYICHYCEKSFMRPGDLKSHEEIHKLEREVIPCPKPNCSRYYTSQHILNDHIKSYHDKRPFVCPVEHCYKAFKTEVALTAHHVLHSRRTRRKKKVRPPFSAKLAGLAPKKWQIDLLSDDKIESVEGTSGSLSERGSVENPEFDDSEEESSITNTLEEAEDKLEFDDSEEESSITNTLEEAEGNPGFDNSEEEFSIRNSFEEVEDDTLMKTAVNISKEKEENSSFSCETARFGAKQVANREC